MVTFATATPIANSVTEAYVMQRYLRPDLLQDAGIAVFDSWAATFGQVVTQVELAPEGGDSFRLKSRFAKFANTPEMLRMLHVAADIKTAEDLKLPVPAITVREDGGRVPEVVTVEPSEALLDHVADLGERADRVRTRAVGPEEDNMLKISGDGRRAALDLRLVGLEQDVPGKTAVAAERIAAIWREHREREYRSPHGKPYPVRGSLQLVFCDLGTPGPNWNVYDDLRDQLVARGLPRESVRFILEAKSDRDKAQLFAACRAGQVAVLVGSTEKMGVGTNVQDRAIALHHLDAPWRPADVAQREGRILRQGNLNAEVQVLRYCTAQSFDGFMWQTLERKAQFIGQIMHGRLDSREITDIGDTALSFSEVKALATGNPLLMDKAEADAALARLQRAERAHHRNQDALGHAIAQHEDRIRTLTRHVADIELAIGRREDTRGEAFVMTLRGARHEKRAAAGQHLKELLEQEIGELDGLRNRSISPGSLGGFSIVATVDRSMSRTTATIDLDGVPGGTLQMSAGELRAADPAGLITRLENRLHQLEARKQEAVDGIERGHREIAHARESLGQPFPQAAQLAEARERVRHIDEQLDQMVVERQAADGAPDQTSGLSTGDGGRGADTGQDVPHGSRVGQESAREPGLESSPARAVPSTVRQEETAAPPNRAGLQSAPDTGAGVGRADSLPGHVREHEAGHAPATHTHHQETAQRGQTGRSAPSPQARTEDRLNRGAPSVYGEPVPRPWREPRASQPQATSDDREGQGWPPQQSSSPTQDLRRSTSADWRDRVIHCEVDGRLPAPDRPWEARAPQHRQPDGPESGM